jgi:predicted ArsR family transcriptional regulator
MSENPAREKISDQDILKVFDNTDDPFLTASEIADQLPVSRQAVNYRLDRMHEEGLVGRKKTGARAVGWWAKVAPRLSDESAERVERAREEIDRGDVVAPEEL